MDLITEVESRRRNSRILRFIGFKTTMGVDMYPEPVYSMAHTFEPSLQSYSSDIFSNDIPTIVQGAFIPEDVRSLFVDDEVLRKFLDLTYKFFSKQRVVNSN